MSIPSIHYVIDLSRYQIVSVHKNIEKAREQELDKSLVGRGCVTASVDSRCKYLVYNFEHITLDKFIHGWDDIPNNVKIFNEHDCQKDLNEVMANTTALRLRRLLFNTNIDTLDNAECFFRDVDNIRNQQRDESTIPQDRPPFTHYIRRIDSIEYYIIIDTELY